MKEISAKLRERRRDRDLTQVELASLAGVSLSVIKSIEKGNPKVSYENVCKVLSVFGLVLGFVETKKFLS